MTKNELILTLENRWMTRGELMSALDMSERVTRGIIARLNEELIAYNKCVVSTSRKKGYHIPIPFNPQDVQLVAVAAKEIHSKSMSLLIKEKAFNYFLKFAESGKESENEKQISLF